MDNDNVQELEGKDYSPMSKIPTDSYSNSWVVTRKSTGQVIGEFFDRRNVEKFNPAKVLIETTHQYLVRRNSHKGENQNDYSGNRKTLQGNQIRY